MNYPLTIPGAINADGDPLSLEPPHLFITQAQEHLPEAGRVLDYGAGNGNNSAYLAEQGYQVFAVDIDAGYLRDSQRLLAAAGGAALDNVHLVRGDLEAPMFRDGSFDIVISSLALQCTQKAEAANTLRKLGALTKPGGVNLIVAYIGTPEQQQQKPTYNLYEPGQIEAEYAQAGWEIMSASDELHDLHQTVGSDGVARTWVSSKSIVLARRPEPAASVDQDLLARAEYYRRSDPEFYELLLQQAHTAA